MLSQVLRYARVPFPLAVWQCGLARKLLLVEQSFVLAPLIFACCCFRIGIRYALQVASHTPRVVAAGE